jgi:hypothetical protein
VVVQESHHRPAAALAATACLVVDREVAGDEDLVLVYVLQMESQWQRKMTGKMKRHHFGYRVGFQ